MGEVQRPCSCVAVDPGDGAVVALKHLADPRFAVERTDLNERDNEQQM